MATPTIDVSLLQHFSPIIIFVLVLVLVYALLQSTKALGDNKIIHALIALVIGLIVLYSKVATDMISYMAPWFTILFVFIIFVLIMYKLFGASDDSIRNVITHHTGLQWGIAIIAIIIIIGAMGHAFGQQALTERTGVAPTEEGAAEEGAAAGEGGTATASFSRNLSATFYHPKILGVLFILILAAFTIRAMSGKLTPDWP